MSSRNEIETETLINSETEISLYQMSRLVLDVACFKLRDIMQKVTELSIPLCVAFINYQKAFDSVNHLHLWKFQKKWDCLLQ